MRRFHSLLMLTLSGAALTGLGCNHIPGKPGPEPEVGRPDHVLDFATLYKQNCVACHGDSKNIGAGFYLANPVYLAVAGESNLVDVLNHGRPGGLMPAFGQAGGGLLTEQQVSVLAKGLITTWGKPGALDGMTAPSFKAMLTPDPAAGQKVFATYCVSCHGTNGTGEGGDVKGAIVDPAFLGLVSDQNLRSIVIAGMNPEMPNFHDQNPEHPLTDQNITDVVGWLASHRSPMQPVVASSPAPSAPAGHEMKHQQAKDQEPKQ